MTKYFDVRISWKSGDVQLGRDDHNVMGKTRQDAEDLVMLDILTRYPDAEIVSILANEIEPSWKDLMQVEDPPPEVPDEDQGIRGITL